MVSKLTQLVKPKNFLIHNLNDEDESMISDEIHLDTQTIENSDEETEMMTKSKIKKLKKKNNFKKPERSINLKVTRKGLPPLKLE